MTIYSIDLDKQQYLEQRLSRGINQFSTPQPGGYTKTSYGTPILHNTCVELSLELGQVSPAVCVKFNVGVTDDDVTEGVFPMHTQDDGVSIQSVKSDEILHIKGKVVTPLRLVLSKHVYEQLLETMNNLTPDVDMASTYADSTNTLMADSSDLLDKAGVPTHSASSNVSRSSSLDQTPTATGINVVGTSQSSKSIALNVITVKFAMPIFNIQLTGDVGEGEEGFLDMKFQVRVLPCYWGCYLVTGVLPCYSGCYLVTGGVTLLLGCCLVIQGVTLLLGVLPCYWGVALLFGVLPCYSGCYLVTGGCYLVTGVLACYWGVGLLFGVLPCYWGVTLLLGVLPCYWGVALFSGCYLVTGGVALLLGCFRVTWGVSLLLGVLSCY